MSQLQQDDTFAELVAFVREVKLHMRSGHVKNSTEFNIVDMLGKKATDLLNKVMS